MKKMKKLFVALILFVSCLGLNACSLSDIFDGTNVGEDEQKIFDFVNDASMEAVKSNFMIFCDYTTGISFMGNSKQGSGVIVKQTAKYYYVITNWHVIDQLPKEGEEVKCRYEAYDYQGNYYDNTSVTLVVKNMEEDLAILKIRKDDSISLPSINISPFNAANGDYVIAIGNPEKNHNSVTVGVVLDVNAEIKDVSYDIIMHSAIIDNGSSGGMLINEERNLVGINTWELTSQSDGEVESGAIPVSRINKFLSEHEDKMK